MINEGMKRNSKTWTCFLLMLASISIHAQSNFNISGRWSGPIGVPLGEDLLGEYDFEQSGLIVQGHIKMTSLNGKDSSRYQFSGVVKNGVVHLKGTKFDYKSPGACLALTILNYSKNEDGEKLIGKWHGNLLPSTCPPGVSGKIELSRVIESNAERNQQSTPSLQVNRTDVEGNALLKALSQRKYYALIIGINEYADDGISDLDNPISDAGEMKRVLQNYYSFDPENIKLLSNPTRTGIIEAFDDFSERITPLDNFLVFYAGHGIWDERLGQGFWLPSDAKKNSKAQWLSNSTIRDYIGGIETKHTLLITDACFSGSIFKERTVTFENSRAILEMYKLASRKAMTSGALKTVPDQSVFITYLTKSLVNNDQPLLSAEDLFRTFKIAVINNSPNGQVPQYGAIGQVGDEGGDFIFLKRSDQ
ncbi:MAG: caspase family protein [Reichenbachiella sp.]|uniref:caspase family protein n=2 Tax=Reichenbachiella sp. TaxID=2184521 RepID=UPI003265120C